MINTKTNSNAIGSNNYRSRCTFWCWTRTGT